MNTHELPGYADRLDALHQALCPEFRSIVQALPLDPTARVLDAGCGDGFYLELLAARLDERAALVAFDASQAYLTAASQRIKSTGTSPSLRFVHGDVRRLPFPDASFDLVWCAQSMQSFSELDLVLREFRRVLRPRGIVAVLETDNIHGLILPWPAGLEVSVLLAEERALKHDISRSGLYFLRFGEKLLAQAGFCKIQRKTYAIDRRAPLDQSFRAYLETYLSNLYRRVEPFLEGKEKQAAADFLLPESSQFVADTEYFCATMIHGLVLGQCPP